MQHFILTRFNLLLWRQDKGGSPVRYSDWLEHRFALFEKYTLPSIKNQTCQEFEWIVLLDFKTPDRFKERIAVLQRDCPQLIQVYVAPENGRDFAEIFRREVIERMNGDRLLTTYLDNDDALDIHFVKDVQARASELEDNTFIYYDDGLQLFTDQHYLMRVHYPRNHFASVVERGDAARLKTIYGYGSHYYIDRIPGVRIERVPDLPLWCEVIHQHNMGNDAYFLRVKMVKDSDALKREFAIDETVESGAGLYIFRFLPRYAKTFVRRAGYFFFGRKWQER